MMNEVGHHGSWYLGDRPIREADMVAGIRLLVWSRWYRRYETFFATSVGWYADGCADRKGFLYIGGATCRI